MPDCLFCKLIKSPEQKKFIIYEDDQFMAFPDISQFTSGHVLVIPKKHYRWIWDLPNIGQYFEVCQKICKKMLAVFHCEQIYTLTMGSMIPHAHVHLIPKTDGQWYEVLQKIGELQQNHKSAEEIIKITKKLKF